MQSKRPQCTPFSSLFFSPSLSVCLCVCVSVCVSVCLCLSVSHRHSLACEPKPFAIEPNIQRPNAFPTVQKKKKRRRKKENHTHSLLPTAHTQKSCHHHHHRRLLHHGWKQCGSSSAWPGAWRGSPPTRYVALLKHMWGRKERNESNESNERHRFVVTSRVRVLRFWQVWKLVFPSNEQQRPTLPVLVLGLQGVGKTTMLSILANEPVPDPPVPTKGMCMYTVGPGRHQANNKQTTTNRQANRQTGKQANRQTKKVPPSQLCIRVNKHVGSHW